MCHSMPKLNLQFAAQMRASVHHNSQGATAVDTNWHTVALTEEGHCFTWGWNWCGQLGTGGTGNRYTPFRVDLDGQKVVAIAAGYEHTAVVTSSAQAWAWGSNTYGQLGAGKLPRNDLLPVRMNYRLRFLWRQARGTRCWSLLAAFVSPPDTIVMVSLDWAIL